MLPSGFSNLKAEDFPEQKSWIAKLLQPINSFFSSVNTILQGNVTFGDNIPCQNINLSFVSNGSDFPRFIKWNIAQNNPNPNATLPPPVDVRVCGATENGVGIVVLIAWSYANGLITFPYIVKITTSGVVGLTSGASYNINMRGFP